MTTRGARPVYLTPWGLYTRYMLGAYLRHTLMVSAALMTIALTIDLWPQMALFSGDALHVVFDIARLAVLRLPDLLPPLALYAGMAYAVFTLIVWRHSEFVRPQLARS